MTALQRLVALLSDDSKNGLLSETEQEALDAVTAEMGVRTGALHKLIDWAFDMAYARGDGEVYVDEMIEAARAGLHCGGVQGSAMQHMMTLISHDRYDTLTTPEQDAIDAAAAEFDAATEARDAHHTNTRDLLQPLVDVVDVMEDRTYSGETRELLEDAWHALDRLTAMHVLDDEAIVAVVATSQHYGGPEEGGWWWYRVQWVVLETVAGTEAATERAQALIDEYADQQPRFPPTSAANTGQPAYEVMAVASLAELPAENLTSGGYS